MLIFKEIKYCKSFLVYMKKIHFISVLKLMGMGSPYPKKKIVRLDTK
ncbi:unnamed protein product [Bacillus thuringiensis DB27]|uniref:Uncharacterized protein n=1 Tax=Bacillus thuringiensis DB27 TaxID=1431339 RepID=W8YD77_BACTU|nr:unnamed protein product [Bacillus thuringiensis DB27]